MPYITLTLAQNGFLALLPFVREEFMLTRTQVGYYTTFFFISGTLFAVFTGRIVDKLGAKKGVLLGTGCMGFIMLLYGFSNSYEFLLFLTLFAGLGHSIITPSVNKGVVIGAPPKKLAVSMGIMQSGYGIGGFAGASLLPILSVNFGWRIAIQIAAVFSLLVGFLVHRYYHEKYFSNSAINNKETLELSLIDRILFLFSNKKLVHLCVLGIVFGVSTAAVLSHFTVFLVEDLNISLAIAGLGIGAFQVGGIVGRPVWGLVSDRFFNSNRLKTLFVMGLIAGTMHLFFGIFINSPQINQTIVFILSFIFGCLAFGWGGVYFASVGEFAGKEQTGIATGLSLLFTRIGMLVAPPIFGYLADMKGNYVYSWLVFGTVLILASSIFYYLSKKNGKRK